MSNKKLGRPAKEFSKDYRITVRFDKREKEFLEKKVNDKGVSLSKYIRDKVLQK